MTTDPEVRQLLWQALDDLSILLTAACQREDTVDVVWMAEQAYKNLDTLREETMP